MYQKPVRQRTSSNHGPGYCLLVLLLLLLVSGSLHPAQVRIGLGGGYGILLEDPPVPEGDFSGGGPSLYASLELHFGFFAIGIRGQYLSWYSLTSSTASLEASALALLPYARAELPSPALYIVAGGGFQKMSTSSALKPGFSAGLGWAPGIATIAGKKLHLDLGLRYHAFYDEGYIDNLLTLDAGLALDL